MAKKLVTDANSLRTMVVNTMRHGELDNATYERLYLLADGFGKINSKLAREQCYDWSHVRDASTEAYKAMAEDFLGMTVEVR